MKKHSWILFPGILIIQCFTSYTQENKFITPLEHFVKFEHISTENGLSQSTILCILQDSRGFMWFGSYSGLNRYDGYNVKIYKAIPGDDSSLSHNIVTAICEEQVVNGNDVQWVRDHDDFEWRNLKEFAGKKARRLYQGFQLKFNKRFSNRWQLLASFLYSKTDGVAGRSKRQDVNLEGPYEPETIIDLHLERQFMLGKGRSIRLMLDWYNMLNENAVSNAWWKQGAFGRVYMLTYPSSKIKLGALLNF